MSANLFVLHVRTEVIDGKASKQQVIEALSTELDQQIETDDGAVVQVDVQQVSFLRRTP